MLDRNINKREWKYAWHYARYDRRHSQISAFVGPALRRAAQFVMEGQSRDRLALRAAIASEPTSNARSAFLYTSRAGFLGRLNK